MPKAPSKTTASTVEGTVNPKGRALGVADADAVRLVRDAIGGLPAT